MGEIPNKKGGQEAALRAVLQGKPFEIDPEIELDYSTFDEGILNLNNGRRRISMKGKHPSTGGRYIHLLQFDVNSEVSIIERDCICNFWNKFDYKF